MGGIEYLVFLNIDFVIVSLGLLSVCWYGMMYLVGFIVVYLLVKKCLL